MRVAIAGNERQMSAKVTPLYKCAACGQIYVFDDPRNIGLHRHENERLATVEEIESNGRVWAEDRRRLSEDGGAV